MQDKINNLYSEERYDFIITSHLGNDLSPFQWNNFWGHDVIFVPAPTIDSLKCAKDYANYCKRAKVNSFNVSDKFFLAFLPNEIYDFDYNKFSNLEKHIYDNNLLIDNIVDYTNVFNQLIDSSLSIDDFENLYQDLGLFKKVESGKKENIKSQPYSYLKNWTDFNTYDCKQSHSLHTLFSCGHASLIYGDTNVGKSSLAIQICISLCIGKGFLGFLSSRPVKCYYLDGELGGKFGHIVMQLLNDIDDNLKNIFMENFKMDSLKGNDHFTETIDVLLSDIDTYKPEIVVLDNLIAISKKLKKGKKHDIFYLLDAIIDIGLSPIIIHHTGKTTGEYLGSSELGALSQNIIRLSNARNLSREVIPSNLDPNDIGKGPFVQLTIEKTKYFPEWENESIFLYRPIDGVWQLLTNWPNNPVPETLFPMSKTDEISNSLSPDERKIWEYVRIYLGGVKRKDVQEHVKMCESKTTNMLKKLIEKGLLKTGGKGPATIYVPIIKK